MIIADRRPASLGTPVSGELLRGSNFAGHRGVKVSLTFGTHQVAVKRSEPRSTLRWRNIE